MRFGLNAGLIIVVYLFEGIGYSLHDFVVVLGKQLGNGRGRGVGGLEQLEGLDVQDGGELNHACWGNSPLSVFDITQEILGTDTNWASVSAS